MVRKRAEPRPLTPLQERGRKLVDKLRGRVKEPSGMQHRSDPRIGVALGGGASRGLTHIPFIEALDEMGIRPAVISGTSIGALIGAGWANGMTGKELRDHASLVLGSMRTIAGRIWATHLGGGIRNVFTNGIPTALDATKVVDSFLPEGFCLEFKDLKTPLYVVATDLQSWHAVVFSSGPIREAIAGSISIPSLFRPVAHANHLLVDGGAVNPLPLDQIDADSDITIGIDVNGDPSETLNRVNYKALDVWFGAAQIMMHSLIAHMMAAYPPDVYIRPHLAQVGSLEFWRVKEIIAHAEKEKDRFKWLLTDKIEAWHADQQRTIATTRPIPRRASQK
jgi:NTE family protein